jgi:hypothetical protein
VAGVAVVSIIGGLVMALYYGNEPFYTFLGGTIFGAGLIFGFIAVVNYRAARKREQWWKSK